MLKNKNNKKDTINKLIKYIIVGLITLIITSITFNTNFSSKCALVGISSIILFAILDYICPSVNYILG